MLKFKNILCLTTLITGMLCASLASAWPYFDTKIGTCTAANCSNASFAIGGNFSERFAAEIGTYVAGAVSNSNNDGWIGAYGAGKLKFPSDGGKTTPYAKLGAAASFHAGTGIHTSVGTKWAAYIAGGVEYQFSPSFYAIGDITHVSDNSLTMISLGIGF